MIYAGTKDGKNYGFYLEPDELIDSVELTEKEHMALMDGQGNGKRIVFHKGEKPTLEEPLPPTEEELARNELRKLQLYLKETDWYVIRFADEGKEIPANVRQKRTEARNKLSELKKKFPNIDA